MGRKYLQRLTATVALLAGLTAAVIVSTPGVSPVVAAKRGDAIQTVQGGVFTALGVLALVSLVLGGELLSELVIALLPAVCVGIAEFAALVVPQKPAMALLLLVFPPLTAHAMYVYGAAQLRKDPSSEDPIDGWHPWKRRAVSWLRDRMPGDQFGRKTLTLLSKTSPVVGIAFGAWVSYTFGLINARASNGIPVLSQVVFVLSAALILFAAPTVAYLAVRAEQQDRTASGYTGEESTRETS